MTRRHPYVGLPDRQFWQADPGVADPAAFDPVSDVPFRITPQTRVVTAGSCFAQHVGHRLAAAGFTHHIAEPAHPMFEADLARQFGYGIFSARYGNIYTARQLLQLLHRAYGLFAPRADHWPRRPGEGPRVVDPFRPQIQPEGFVSAAELAADRVQHLAAVRSAIETMEVFIFTLGLTEAWQDKADGAIFPLAPGVAGGVWDPQTVGFVNFDEAETAADLAEALAFIRARNPAVRIILTVSPVPLNATFEPRHVAVSTTWSKAVLRIAAEKMTRRFDACCYFPSYEIITAPQVRGRYFAADGREVLEAGVDHVMGLFFRHFAEGAAIPADGAAAARNEQITAVQAEMAALERQIELLCDEQAITNR